jgi:hypothetical protein
MAICYSAQSGNWSDPTTWVTVPSSGGGDRIIIRPNHVVIYDLSAGEFGDDGNVFTTGTTTTVINAASGNAIFLSGGTLKASRTTNTSLTARGNICIGLSGYLDWGTSTDPLTTNATLTLNYANPLSTNYAGKGGIYLYASANSSTVYYNSITMYGKYKNRNATLTLSALSGSNTISVDNLSGWEIGDKLIIESDNTAVSRVLSSTFITGITGNDVGISVPINFTRLSGTKVGNFSSNLTVRSQNPSFPSYGVFVTLNNGLSSNVEFGHIRFDNVGSAQWVSNVNTTLNSAVQGAMSFSLLYLNKPLIIESVAIDSPQTASTTGGIYMTQANSELLTINNSAIYLATNYGFNFNAQVNINVNNSVIYRSNYNCLFGGTFPANVIFSNCNFSANNAVFGPGVNGLIVKVNNSKLRSAGYITALDGIQRLNFNNCNITSVQSIVNPNFNSIGNIYFTNCTVVSGLIARQGTNKTNALATINFYQTNLSAYDYRKFNYFYYAQTDLNVRKNGITSYRIKPEQANTQFNVYETLPAIQNVPQRIKGNLRFDTNYGITNPPTISFIGAGVNVLCACDANVNTWQPFDVTLNPTSTDDITVTITGQSTLTSGYVWLDGFPIYPFIQDVRHYGFIFDKTQDRTVNSLTTLTENQVSALDVVTNLDYLYDAASYWSATNPSSSSYIDLFTANGTILDFGNKNFIINNTGTGFSYDSGTNTITLDAPSLSAGINFNTLKTTGTITLSTGVIYNIDVNANLVQNIPTNLSGIYMLSSSNTLTFNTNIPIEVEYTNCTMVGVKNDGTAIVTIKRTNSTVTESDDEVVTYAPTLINLTLQGGYIALYDNTTTRQYFQNTDGTIILPANATGNWSYKIARYGYQLVAGSFTVNPAIGGTIEITPNYIPDTFINENDVSIVSGYTDLNSTAKIHDYLSYYLTTSQGIDYGVLDSESFGALSFYGNLVMSATANSIVDYNSGTNTLILKSSSVNDSIIFVVASAFSQTGGNTIGDDVKIRSSNLDSEIYFTNINSINFYPSLSDRDNNTNLGISLSSKNIYRYKYGSIVNGVTFTDYIYNRITINGTTLLYTTPISIGSTTIDLGTVGNLQSILNNQKIINTGVQKASKLIPHTTNV